MTASGDWLSGRALRSHRRGHWFEPSIAHRTRSLPFAGGSVRRHGCTMETMSRPLLCSAARLHEILDRDGATCVWCARPFTGLIARTTEHVVPRVKDGPSRLENEVPA